MSDNSPAEPSEPTLDRRARKTQNALHDSFAELVLERHYDEISVADIVDGADVGRSTFYEHFRDKDELLLASMAGFFTVLSEAPWLGCDLTLHSRELQPLECLLAHFLENRVQAHYLLEGPPSLHLWPQIVRRLAQRIGDRLQDPLASGAKTLLPPNLLCEQIAEAQLGQIRVWFRSREPAEPALVALALARASRALLTAGLLP